MRAPQADTTVRDLVLILGRRWLLIALCVILGGVAAASYSLTRDKQYRAKAQVEVSTQPTGLGTTPPNQDAATADREVQTAIVELESPAVRRVVSAQFGAATPTATGTQISNTNVIEVAVESTKAAHAAQVANSYAQSLAKFRTDEGAAQQKASIDTAKKDAQSLSTSIDRLTKRIAESRNGDKNASETAALEAERVSVIDRRSDLEGKIDDARLQGTTGSTTVLSTATPPSSPSSPKTARNIVLGVAFGLLVGIALALLREQFVEDRRLADPPIPARATSDF